MYCRSAQEEELDNDFDKLTSVVTKLLHQVKVLVQVLVHVHVVDMM